MRSTEGTVTQRGFWPAKLGIFFAYAAKHLEEANRLNRDVLNPEKGRRMIDKNLTNWYIIVSMVELNESC